MKQYIIFHTTCNTKLSLVKTIKEHLGLGLKEAKELMDDGFNNLGKPILVEGCSLESMSRLRNAIRTDFPELLIDTTGDQKEERKKFFLDMDMGDENDYIEYLSSNYTNLLFTSSFDDVKKNLRNIFSKINLEDLKVLYNVYTEHIEEEKRKFIEKRESINDSSW